MNPYIIFEKFWEVIDALEKEGVDYILIGEFTMVLYGMPRANQYKGYFK